jgi:hypothetical protein
VGEVDRAVAALAGEQHGAISHAQVMAFGADRGLPRRRTSAGVWRRAAHGVYVIAGSQSTFEQRAMVALLSAGPGAMISHRTAGLLWGLVGGKPGPIELSVPRGRHHPHEGVVVHRSRDLDRARTTRRQGIPVTGAARTILDIGAVDPDAVRPAVWRGLRDSVVAWPILLRTLIEHSRRGRSGIGPLRAVVAEHYGELATDSGTEDVAFEILADSGRVPLPDKQVPVVCADGVPVTIDLGWPRYRALVEIFGVDHLTNEDLQHLDLHRRNQIELTGQRLLVYTGRLLRKQPDQFVTDVEALLRGGGWCGPRSGHGETLQE